jgi:type IV pilus assembly protein PilF
MSRLFPAWPLALALALSGCKHVPTERERQSSEIHYNLGIQAQEAGNIQDALSEFQQAVAQDPDNADARNALGILLHLSFGRHAEAIQSYEKVLNDMLYPTPFIAQSNLGWAYFKKGDTAKALENIKSAVTLNPNFCRGYQNLGFIYDQQGDTQEACRQFSRYREMCPEVADAYMREGVCQAKMGKADAARESFTSCENKAAQPALKDECRRLREHL